MANRLIRLRRLLVIVTLILASLFVWSSGAKDWSRLRKSPEERQQRAAEESSGTGGLRRVRSQWFNWKTRIAHPARDESGEQEWMDLPGNDPHELTDMFDDLRRLNHWFGGWSMTARGLAQFISQLDPSQPVKVLDVATGSADIPNRLARWAREQGHEMTIIATDRNPAVLEIAVGSDDSDDVQLIAADALRLPFADDSFDVAASSFFIHHLTVDEAVAALREMSRVSRHGVLINDLVRSWSSFLGAWTFSRIFTRNGISRHDAVLSARRSYSFTELIELTRLAGLEPEVSYNFAGYRVVVVLRPKSRAGGSVDWSSDLSKQSLNQGSFSTPGIVQDSLSAEAAESRTLRS